MIHTSEPLTQKQFIEEGGSCCPSCKGSDIESEGIEVDGSIAWAEVSCNECSATWQELYKICGYDNLEIL